jgi:fermentation-respiration switch protein FrsA (DUF1100 family)
MKLSIPDFFAAFCHRLDEDPRRPRAAVIGSHDGGGGIARQCDGDALFGGSNWAGADQLRPQTFAARIAIIGGIPRE